MNNVMLSTLKWLGLVCRHDSHRLHVLLTGRAVLLGDVASACLEASLNSSVSSLSDSQSGVVLFLPQVLHVLSLLVKQPVPNPLELLPRALVTHLLLSGLPDKL